MKKYLLFTFLFCQVSNAQPSLFFSDLQGAHNLIKLREAYQQNPGINGQNLNIFIVDSGFNANHPSLKNKDLRLVRNPNFFALVSDRERFTLRQGTHSAGITLGADLNEARTPRGIAYNAGFYGIAYSNSPDTYRPHIYGDFEQNFQIAQNLSATEIKVISANYGAASYPIINRKIRSSYEEQGLFGKSYAALNPDAVFDFIIATAETVDHTENLVVGLTRLARDKNVLSIFPVGDEGMPTPRLQAVLPSFDESLRAWLAVGSVNYDDVKNNRITNLPLRANLFKGAATYGIIAPGVNIDSANAYFQSATSSVVAQQAANDTNGAFNSGFGAQEFYNFNAVISTHAAASIVSGAALLVQQKFPFLNGAQIADVLLSTANKNFTHEKLYVKQTGNFYSVVYVGQDIPRSGNRIEINQVRQDLSVFYNSNDVDTILNNLLPSMDFPPGATPNDQNFEAIYSLTKEEVFGQGILDVEKALKGLSILDANRLRLGSSRTIDGVRTAFYTIDTQGFISEFSNDISQRKWENNLHLQNAYNSPRNELNGLNVGLVKSGAGILTLSGRNTYEGATIAQGGVLRILGNSNFTGGATGADSVNANAKGVLVNSKAYALGGVLQLENAYLPKGAVSESGVIQIVKNARVDSEMTARNGGEINLAGSNLYLGASSAPLTLNLLNGGTLSGDGQIYGNVHNTSGVLMTGFSSLQNSPFQNLSINGTYTHSQGAQLLISFSADSENAQNSKLSATTYSINGGELVYVPIFSSNKRLKDAQEFTLELGDLQNHLDDFTKVYAQETNTMRFNVDSENKNILSVEHKTNMFVPQDTGNTQLGNILATIAFMDDLPQDYASFFNQIDLLDSQGFQNVLSSIESNAHLESIQSLIDSNQSQSVEQINFVLSPFSSFTKTQKVAFNGFGTANAPYGFMKQSNNEFALNAAHTTLKHSKYKTSSNSFGFSVKQQTQNGAFGAFVDYAKSSSTHTNANVSSDYISGGVGGILDVGLIELLGFASAGYGKNQVNRQVLSAGQLKGEFDNFVASMQAGIAKDFKIGKWLSSNRGGGSYLKTENFVTNFALRPMILGSHMIINQSAYDETNGLFSKQYSAKSHGITSVISGLNANSSARLKNGVQVGLNAFAFYIIRLDSEIANSASFKEFKDLRFTQKSTINKNSNYLGANIQVSKNQYFAKAGVYDEFNQDYNSLSLALNLGFLF